ncbi:MAG: class I SAM-dependent rRNA methyltransferase, partial [bacterium]
MVEKIELNERGLNKRRHDDPMIYRSELAEGFRENPPGCVVDLYDSNQNFFGRGFYSRGTDLAVRVVSGSKININKSFFKDRIEQAIQLRSGINFRHSYRIVNGFGDYLPGLVVDRYGDILVVQFRNQTIDRFESQIIECLNELVTPDTIYARNDTPVREDREGLERYKGVLKGNSIPDRVHVRKEPYEIITDIKHGQKTGAFLDQGNNRRRMWSYAPDGTVLDCYCYNGSWGLACLHGGSSTVTFVDQSSHALDLVEENCRLNNWQDRAYIQQEDVMDYLNETTESPENFDCLILDPPSFTRSKRNVTSARKGYKEINFRAMKVLKPKGMLVTSSCSAPVHPEMFRNIISESAHDAHVNVQTIERRFQGPDHPWLQRLDFTRYL